MGFTKVFKELVERKQRAESGKFNCIPFPFPRFRNILPGIERGKFLIITANQKIGKSKFCDFMFIYEPIFFAIDNPQFHFKVIYFTLEMSPTAKYQEFLSHLLYRLDGLVISPTDLKSVDSSHPVKQEILDLLQTDRYQKYIKFYEEHVEYYCESSNPTGLRKIVRAYADTHGTYNHVKFETINEVTGEKEIKQRLDPDNPYTPNDPEEYVVVITDNAANITTEKGMTQKEAIEKWSKDQIVFRDQLNYICVLIQHQSQQVEGIESRKMDMVIPSSQGLAVSKTTSNDASMVIGLYNPFKYGKKDYEGFNLERLRDYARFMVVCEDRDYGANNNICPLFFNGASSYWAELPLPNNTSEMNAVYSHIESLENRKTKKTFFLKVLLNKLKQINNG